MKVLVWKRKIILRAPITQMHCWRLVLKYKFSTEAIRLEVTCTGREPRARLLAAAGPKGPPQSPGYICQTQPQSTVIS